MRPHSNSKAAAASCCAGDCTSPPHSRPCQEDRVRLDRVPLPATGPQVMLTLALSGGRGSCRVGAPQSCQHASVSATVGQWRSRPPPTLTQPQPSRWMPRGAEGGAAERSARSHSAARARLPPRNHRHSTVPAPAAGATRREGQSGREYGTSSGQRSRRSHRPHGGRGRRGLHDSAQIGAHSCTSHAQRGLWRPPHQPSALTATPLPTAGPAWGEGAHAAPTARAQPQRGRRTGPRPSDGARRHTCNEDSIRVDTPAMLPPAPVSRRGPLTLVHGGWPRKAASAQETQAGAASR